MGIYSEFVSTEAFHFEDAFGQILAVYLDKQVFISWFLYILLGSCHRDNLSC